MTNLTSLCRIVNSKFNNSNVHRWTIILHHSLKQEYTTMSRRPGIAADWFAKYYEDVYPSDSIYVNGRVMRPPKYYDVC
jgi:hypothetical protein